MFDVKDQCHQDAFILVNQGDIVLCLLRFSDINVFLYDWLIGA